MPISSLSDSLAMSILQRLIGDVQGAGVQSRDRGEVGGGFGAIRSPSGPVTFPTAPGPSTLNDMVSGTFALPGNRGIQGQLLRMLGNSLQPNSPLAALGSMNPQLPRPFQFPEFVVPMLREFR